PELIGFVSAVSIFTILSRSKPKETVEVPATLITEINRDQPLNIVKALLPPLPIAMLFLLQPRFKLVPPILQLYPQGLPASHAMLISAMVALLGYRKDLSAQTKAFFEGTGFAYVNVISLIITATCFIKGMEVVGLMQMFVSAITNGGFLGKLASGFFPWVLAV